MPRLPPLPPQSLTEEQRRVAADILATRGTVGGPFAVWLRSPELAERAQLLGAFVRYHSSLPPRLLELAILITARLWTAQFEWAVHAPEARAAGLPAAVIDDLREGRRPAGLQADEAVIWDFVQELHATRAIADATYQRAHDLLGTRGVVDLVGICGYYTLISMTLNVFDCDTPDGSRPLAPL